MNNAASLGPRPSDPSAISFAADCFETTGERTEYHVIRDAVHSGPAKFNNRADAEAFARKSNRSVTEQRFPVTRRVRWN
jgi:hypothetical protein